jgi:hypothetical protein
MNFKIGTKIETKFYIFEELELEPNSRFHLCEVGIKIKIAIIYFYNYNQSFFIKEKKQLEMG